VAKAVEELLSYTALGRVITSVRRGIPDPLPPEFRGKAGGTRQEYRGNGVRSVVVKGTRRTAQRTEYGSPAVRRAQLPIEAKEFKMLHSFHELQPFDWLLLEKLRSYTEYEQRGAAQEVTRQMEGFADLFENLEVASVLHAIVKGHIYFDANGNLLPTSSGNTLDVNYGIPANNQNQLNGIIAASWATAGTDIAGDIREIKKRALQETGYQLKYAFYGSNIPGYLYSNTQMKEFLVRTPDWQTKYSSTNEIGMFLDLIWVPIWMAFYEDSAGTVQDVAIADNVVFTPEPTVDWYEWMVGSYGVPKNFNPSMSAAAALGDIQEVYGRFAYAVPDHNPPCVRPYAGNTWLPAIKVPEVVYIADVVP
jgi:hypothetical protein